jgi:hypothetical protein
MNNSRQNSFLLFCLLIATILQILLYYIENILLCWNYLKEDLHVRGTSTSTWSLALLLFSYHYTSLII